MWRRGEEVFAEVALPREEQRREADSFGLHPALLDASLHALAVGASSEGEQREVLRAARMPFSWSGVSLHAAGASALRVRLERVGDDAFAVTATDGEGTLVATVDSLALRGVPAGGFGVAPARHRDALFALEWVAADLDASEGEGAGEGGWTVLSCTDVSGVSGDGVGVLGAVREGVCGVLDVLQEWLSDESLAGRRLVVLTREAVDAAGRGVMDSAGGSVWGLVRAAQTEHPGRFVLVDVEAGGVGWDGVARAVASGEPEVAVRGGELLVPRLVRAAPGPGVDAETGAGARSPAATDARGGGDSLAGLDVADGGDDPLAGLDVADGGGDSLAGLDVADGGDDSLAGLDAVADGAALVTGGTGGLGALVARHLVERCGVRDLVLVSRRGPDAEGAGDLERELEAMGARVRIRACDVSDRGELHAVITAIGDSLRMVVHAAGVLDDGVIESLTAERVTTMLTAKVDGAWHLHELTRDLNVREFVLFSSAAGVFGGAGQGGYAAANTFLDGLASRRRAEGLPGVSVAWGLWAQRSEMTGGLRAGDRARLERQGMRALENDEGLELFDMVRASPLALVVPIHLDLRAARVALGDGEASGLLRGLIGGRPRRARAGVGGSLRRRLERLPASERLPVVLELVRAQAAAVLGHPSTELVEAGRAFKELGFDSLAAVELRNRLEAASGLRLPATSVFDHPSPAALAEHLLGLLDGVGGSVTVARRVRVEEPIAIVGMSCRYPGGVSSPRELWELVAAGAGWDLGVPRGSRLGSGGAVRL